MRATARFEPEDVLVRAHVLVIGNVRVLASANVLVLGAALVGVLEDAHVRAHPHEQEHENVSDRSENLRFRQNDIGVFGCRPAA